MLPPEVGMRTEIGSPRLLKLLPLILPPPFRAPLVLIFPPKPMPCSLPGGLTGMGLWLILDLPERDLTSLPGNRFPARPRFPLMESFLGNTNSPAFSILFFDEFFPIGFPEISPLLQARSTGFEALLNFGWGALR